MQANNNKINLLGSIGAFKKSALKESVTTVTDSKGSVWKEQRTANGGYELVRTNETTKDMSYLRHQEQNNNQQAQDNIDSSSVPRFDVDDPAFLSFLQDHGFVVVRQVADPSQVQVAHNKLWKFLTQRLGWDRQDPAKWTNTSFANAGLPHTGILYEAGVGQSDLQWYIRSLPSIQKAFSKIWKKLGKGHPQLQDVQVEGTNDLDLLTSFDGINVFRPWANDATRKTRSGWTHVDQGRNQLGFRCVQGLVSLTDATPETGGFVAVAGSHNYHESIVQLHATSDQDYVKVPLDSTALPADMRHRLRFVPARAGDLILWDSRTIHANIPAWKEPTPLTKSDSAAVVASKNTPTPELLRAVSYVCMTPKSLATEAVLQARRHAFVEGKTTNHWPHLIPDDMDAIHDSDHKGALSSVNPVIRALVG